MNVGSREQRAEGRRRFEKNVGRLRIGGREHWSLISSVIMDYVFFIFKNRSFFSRVRIPGNSKLQHWFYMTIITVKDVFYNLGIYREF